MAQAMSPPDPRAQIRRRSSINVVLGIWLAVSPWILGYGHGDPRWSDIVLGSLVAGAALARATGAYREAYLSWFNVAVGVWLVVAGLAVDHTAVATWNDLGVGATVFVVAIASIEASARLYPHRRRMPPPSR
jgi:SPW repeat